MKNQNLLILISKLSVLILTFFAPILIFIYAIIFLTTIDLITAIIRDYKNKKERNKGELLLESRKLRKSVTKTFLYILFIASTYVLMEVTFSHTFFIPNLVFGSLALVEVVSIGENMARITDNNIFIKITRKISKIFTEKIDNLFK